MDVIRELLIANEIMLPLNAIKSSEHIFKTHEYMIREL